MSDRSESARERRVRRKLGKVGQKLWKIREGQWSQYGPYCVIDTQTNTIAWQGVSLEAIEDDLGIVAGGLVGGPK